MRSILMSLASVAFVCISFSGGQAPPVQTPEQALDKVVGRHLAPVSEASLKECQTRLDQLREWADKNYPIGKSLEADNVRLVKENEDLEEEVRNKDAQREMLFGAGLGLGIAAVYLIYRGIKKIWPPSSQHKQLVVLLFAAVWVMVASMIAVETPPSVSHGMIPQPYTSVGLTELRAIVYSLPGLLFGGIGFWWFGRKIVVRLF